jgi:ankyrin repeat protein
MGSILKSPHLEVVKILLENGANLHVGDNYALQSASRNGHLEVVEILKSNVM